MDIINVNRSQKGTFISIASTPQINLLFVVVPSNLMVFILHVKTMWLVANFVRTSWKLFCKAFFKKVDEILGKYFYSDVSEPLENSFVFELTTHTDGDNKWLMWKQHRKTDSPLASWKIEVLAFSLLWILLKYVFHPKVSTSASPE